MDNVENIPKAMVDGLRSLDPNELTIEEAAALDYADEQEQIQQNNRDAIDEILDAIQGMPNAPGRHEIEAWQGQFGVVYVSSVTGSGCKKVIVAFCSTFSSGGGGVISTVLTSGSVGGGRMSITPSLRFCLKLLGKMYLL